MEVVVQDQVVKPHPWHVTKYFGERRENAGETGARMMSARLGNVCYVQAIKLIKIDISQAALTTSALFFLRRTVLSYATWREARHWAMSGAL